MIDNEIELNNMENELTEFATIVKSIRLQKNNKFFLKRQKMLYRGNVRDLPGAPADR